MCCPPVRGDNPRALASGLSYVKVDTHGKLFYTIYISVDLAHHEIFRAIVCKGGIKIVILFLTRYAHYCHYIISMSIHDKPYAAIFYQNRLNFMAYSFWCPCSKYYQSCIE